MKNQYFGDVNDYLKYGLLRAITLDTDWNLLVAWMLTPDDGGPDGKKLKFLEAPDTWARYDSPLFEGLVDLLRSAPQRSVSLIEGSDLLPRASYYSAVVPDTHRERDAWSDGLLRGAKDADLVFLDPDNGIEVPSKPIGHKGSSKYVTWDELKGLWNAGSSLLIYQHFRRERRDPFILRMVENLHSRIGADFVEAFRTAHVLFLLAAQDRHAQKFADNVSLLAERWNGQIEPVGLANFLSN
jgi:hypothetical protein